MNLADPETLREFLGRHGLSPRKGLGQHFLCSTKAVEAVLGCLVGSNGILEIGPGPGVLTGPLSEHIERVVALEIDAEMVSALKESAPAADVRRIDARKADLRVLLEELPRPRAVVSNLPYYITGPLITRIAAARDQFDRAVLMMQKEVGERLIASPGDRARGSISVYLQALFDVRRVSNVPAGSFLPPPKVDSVIMEFIPRKDAGEDDAFFELVRQGFAQPRKTVANNLAAFGRDKVSATLQSIGRDPRVRPHELALESWRALHAKLVEPQEHAR